MASLRAALIVLIAAAFLSACAVKPEVPFDKTAANVKTIGILTPYCPERPGVLLASSVGQSFGLIGGLVDAGMRSARESKFNTIMQQQNFSLQDFIVKSISDRLTAGGYTVSFIPVPRGRMDFLKQYPKAEDTKVDAYLDLVVRGYGYVAAGIGSSTPYRPGDLINVRLVRARDGVILMDDTVSYNPIGPSNSNIVTISPDPRFEFTDFDTLTGDPVGATKGLQVCLDQTADAVVKLLR